MGSRAFYRFNPGAGQVGDLRNGGDPVITEIFVSMVNKNPEDAIEHIKRFSDDLAINGRVVFDFTYVVRQPLLDAIPDLLEDAAAATGINPSKILAYGVPIKRREYIFTWIEQWRGLALLWWLCLGIGVFRLKKGVK